jgi:type II secretory pathway component PulM
MFRHPKYLDIPWDVHWQQRETRPQRHLWWLMALLILAAMFLIGVGVTSGIK